MVNILLKLQTHFNLLLIEFSCEDREILKCEFYK